MVLEADVDPADLSSLRSVVSGTAPLDPDDADAFTERYGIPVLISYGATEFGGGVAGWNLADHREFWATKRGSVGRAHAGCELRIVDASSGDVARRGHRGPARGAGEPARRRRDWVRTTDLARIDGDGFLWILGRADQAIIRGGFKVLPEVVRTALERHPDVRGAAVIGRTDRRLGAVPVAAVELRPGARPRRPRTSWPTPRACWPATSSPPRSASWTPCRAPTRPRSTWPRWPPCSTGPARRPDAMDLAYSDADEAFRGEVRRWLDEAVVDHGPPPPPGDWDVRRAYDTGWQRRLHDAGYAGLSWPAEFGGRGLPASQQLVYLEECAAAGAPYVGDQLRRQRPRRAHADRRGHRRAAAPPPAAHPPRRGRVVPGLLRARGRVRPGVAAHASRAARATSTS